MSATTKAKTVKSIAAAYGSRPGVVKQSLTTEPAEPMTQGLELSEIFYKPRAFFHYNPANEPFRALKTEKYFADLERDIREAGQVIEPLIAMPDGLILSGESRFIVTDSLDLEGVPGFDRLPVRLVLSPMTEEEQTRRLMLANLSRFEIDEDTRLLLYAKIWPGFYDGATVAPAPKVRELVEATGKSKRQVIRDGQISREATAKAKEEGREATVEDVREARAAKNEARKASPPQESPAILRVRQALANIKAMEATENNPDARQAFAISAKAIEEALR